MVRPPSVEEEDRRRICRERQVLIIERTQHINRIKGLLFAQGITGYERLRRDRRERLEDLRTGDGRVLATHVRSQIDRELDRLELIIAQIKVVEDARAVLLAEQTAHTPAAMLLNVKGIGPEFATILYAEGLFRHFDNRRQLAAYAGLAPTPGKVDRSDRSRASPRPATAACERPWSSCPGSGSRYQPDSALARWFQERVQHNGGRLKKPTIVALARKLLVALWKYATAGVVIEGAVMKAA